MRALAKAFVGVGFGLLLLWLVLSRIDIEQGRLALVRANMGSMALAVVAYWLAILFRIVRWRLLLSGAGRLSFGQVSQALIIGYAVNNVLPARLGEIFRADLLRRRFGISRSAALGSIIVERLLDGMSVVILLGIGLTAIGSLSDNKALVMAAIAGCGLVAIGLAAVYAMVTWHTRLPLRRFPWLAARVGPLVQGMTAVGGPQFVKVLVLTATVWSFEAAAVYLIVRGFDIDVAFLGVCLTVGVAALSTLLPSAPGYLGSLQAAFVLAYSSLGIAPVLGVLSATAVQLLLLGSVTLVGLGMLVPMYFYRAARSVRQLFSDNKQRHLGASTH